MPPGLSPVAQLDTVVKLPEGTQDPLLIRAQEQGSQLAKSKKARTVPKTKKKEAIPPAGSTPTPLLELLEKLQ